MAEPYQRRVQTKDPPVEKFVRAIKVVGDWIIKNAKALIVPSAAGADALVVRDYGDVEDRFRVNETGYIYVLGGKIFTPNCVLVEKDIVEFAVKGFVPYDPTETFMRPWVSGGMVIVNNPIRTPKYATGYYELQSYDGAAYVVCAKLIGGYFEIAKGKLTGGLDANGCSIINLDYLMGRRGNYDFHISARRTATYAGDALFMKTYNSLDAETNRLVITGGVDIAEIKIANSKLNLQSNKLLNPKTFTVRPALADMEVGEIAFGIGTGPAGEDEIFFKPDATRISYWTASGIITA